MSKTPLSLRQLSSYNRLELVPGVDRAPPVDDLARSVDHDVLWIHPDNKSIYRSFCVGGLEVVEFLFSKILFHVLTRVRRHRKKDLVIAVSELRLERIQLRFHTETRRTADKPKAEYDNFSFQIVGR